MGFAGVSVSQLLIILLIVVAIFGTKRLKTMGGDLGATLKSFRNAMNAPDEPDTAVAQTAEPKRPSQDAQRVER